jgi:hypothetical protein
MNQAWETVQEMQMFRRELWRSCNGRSYFSTRNKRLALGPPGIRKGDAICIFYGASTPFVLRFDDNGTAKLIGDAYVHGLMNGEGLAIDDRCEDQLFQLI